MLCRRVGLLVVLLSSFLFDANGVATAAEKRPNILYLLADDLGFADLGCYGGQIDTPNVDGLAKNGLQFTQFYNTARCWPTRAATLTGYYAQQIHCDTRLDGSGRGARPSWAPLVSDYLRPLGYRNYHSGKWHLSGLPLESGFDHSYVIDDHNRFFNPQKHTEDDKPLPPVPEGTDFYLTTHIASHAIKCLKEHAEQHADKPFFQYVAFTSPHFPLQAPQKDIDKYRGRFAAGWDKLREQRWKTLKDRGVVNCGLSARTEGVPAWDELSAEDKAKYEMRMMIHAAMVDRMDQEIGRILAQLKAMNVFENTVIFFASDNGASAEIILRGDGNDPNAPPGSAKTFLCLEPGGANVANSPFRRSKIFVHEGGISTPLVVHWPSGLKAKGELRRNPGHVIDLPPTFMELAGGTWPTERNGKPLPPIPGRSLVPAFANDGSVKHDYFWWLHEKNRAVRVGDWKLVALRGEPWELYNLAVDRCEMQNLAESEPKRAASMAALWEKLEQDFADLAATEPAVPDMKGKKRKAAAAKE
jgi:arylsulfatase